MPNLTITSNPSYFNQDVTVTGSLTVGQNIVGNVVGTLKGDILGNINSPNITTNNLLVTGITTLGSSNGIGTVTVGIGTTALFVSGNARVTNFLSIGTSSIVLDGTTNNIIFNDGSIQNSLYTLIPKNSVVTFHQAAAPTGWTQITTHNNKALRVVSGTGGGSGGNTAFTTVFASRTPTGTNSGGAVQNTTLQANQLPDHAHGYSAPGGLSGCSGPCGKAGFSLAGGGGGAATGGAGYSAGGHNHGLTQPTFTGNAMDFAVQYIDLIIASRN